MEYYQSSRTTQSSNGLLDVCLEDILCSVKPLESDRIRRLDTIKKLTAVIGSMEKLKGALVKPFGSFVSNLYTKWGDLDVSVEFHDSSHHSHTGKRKKQNVLRDILGALLRAGIVHNFQFIPNARIPLLIFESNSQHISCDISINNPLGLIKSKFLLWISGIDERFRDMVLLTKEWAKAQKINDPKSGTLNSHSLCLLVIFHFQTCQPPILPPLKEIYGGNIAAAVTGMWKIAESQIEEVCSASIARFRLQAFCQKNQTSLSQLLISFFKKFSTIETLSSEYAICTYTGQLENIRSNPRWLEKPHPLFIEDPFEQPDNAARAVGLRELRTISTAFREAHGKLSSRSILQDRNSILANLVRPGICSQAGPKPQTCPVNGGPKNHPRKGFSESAAHQTVHFQSQGASNPGRGHPYKSSTHNLLRQGAPAMQQQQVWQRKYSSK